jgi:4-amino-4-deoxy-L-arabinose transferase-like glycosyltransferase
MKTKRKIPILIYTLILTGFLLRVYKIDTDLLFHRDQGLIASDIYKIWHDKKISLLGHPTDTEGLIHAPIYYWLMTPAYALGNGDPVLAAIFQVALELTSLPFLYLAIKKLFDIKTAKLTIFLYAFSYGLVSYSRWLSNVPNILPFSNLLLYVISLEKSETKYVFASSLLAGIITQFNAAAGVFLFPFLILLYRKKDLIRNIFVIISGFCIPALPYIIFQFRNNFVLVKALLTFFKSQEAGLGTNSNVFLTNLLTLIKQINAVTLYPFVIISTFLVIYGFLKIKNKYAKSVVILLFACFYLGLSLFKRGAISFFFISLLPLSVAIFIYAINNLPKKISLMFLAATILLNIYQLKNIYKPTNALIPIGDSNLITIQDRKNIIDYMYLTSDGEQFSVWFYSIPYYQDYAWDYLLKTYAFNKYGYLPEKTANFSPIDLKKSKYFFNIYEPDYDNPENQERWLDKVNNNFGEVVDIYRTNDLVLQLRSWKPDKI